MSAEAVLSVRIPGRPPDLHQQGQHRKARARVIRERRALVRAYALGARHGERLEAATSPKRLRVTVAWRGTRRDSPNLLQDLKADVDALVDAGWLVDDKDEWLTIDYPPTYTQAAAERDVCVIYHLFEAAPLV